MKSSLTFLLVLFSLSCLFAQTECTVKIVYAMNKSLPPSYTFKTDPITESAKYYWSFGDKTNSDSPSPTHTFKTSDTYLVQVKVTTPEGKSCYGEVKTRFEGGTTTISNILSGKGKVKKVASTDGCGLLITLENGTIIVPVEMIPTFEFKDGQYVELAYELLKDKPSGCNLGISAKIHKIAEIIVPTVCKIPITFEKKNTTPVSYKFRTDIQPSDSKFYWYFGDGGSSSLVDPTYTFKKAGSWVINLKVVDKAGKVCYGEAKATFEGETNPPMAARGKVKKLTVAGCDLVIVLENATLVPFKMATDFLLKEGQYVEFTYEKFAEKVSTCKEGTDVKILTIKEIQTTPECKAYFTATNKIWSDPAMMKKVSFSNLSVGEIQELTWNFGDNTALSKEAKPIHEYKEFGSYKVCLSILTKEGCKSEYCAEVKVENLPVVATCKFDIVVKPKEATPNTFLFYAVSSAEIKTWKWNFGDGKTGDRKNPEHAYEKTGTYEVSCTVTTAAGCTETRTIKHTVLAAPLANCTGAISILLFDPTDNKCNGKATVILKDASGNDITGVKYLWNNNRTGSIVDGLCPDKTYSVQASVEGVCQKSYSFTFLSKPIWRASTINGQNNFIVISPKEGVEYEWSFGDGFKLKGAEVSYSFENDGVYNVTLKAVSGSDFSEFSQQVVVMKSITGTDIINKSELEVFPNPVKEMLIINFGNPVQGVMQIDIMNIAGQRTFSQQLKTEGFNQTAVNIKHLKSGIYFLRITNGKYLIADRKFIKAE
ncbi:MAG: PKD domain-containing protein [Bacteroidota bacterium]|nr:PKD domain-containing protein [Bacteroidota bacterium]